MRCAIDECVNATSAAYRKETNADKTSFHKFPKLEANRNLWLSILGMKERNLKAHTSVCGLHFTDDDYCAPSGGGLVRSKLNLRALPTQNLPPELEKENAYLYNVKRRRSEESQMSEELSLTQIPDDGEGEENSPETKNYPQTSLNSPCKNTPQYHLGKLVERELLDVSANIFFEAKWKIINILQEAAAQNMKEKSQANKNEAQPMPAVQQKKKRKISAQHHERPSPPPLAFIPTPPVLQTKPKIFKISTVPQSTPVCQPMKTSFSDDELVLPH